MTEKWPLFTKTTTETPAQKLVQLSLALPPLENGQLVKNKLKSDRNYDRFTSEEIDNNIT